MKISFPLISAVVAFLFVVGVAIAPAVAGDKEIQAAQSVIDSQIKAFLSDDNAAAYSHAAPSIRKIFPTVESFMAMVTRGYQPVWKPDAYRFGKSAEIDDRQIAQQVLVTGPDGQDYEAVYTLQRQDDGTYKITGVRLRKAVSTGA